MPQTATTSETEFGDAWEAFFRAARRARARRGSPEGCELTLPQYQMLEPLIDGPSKVGALASAAGISAPTATRMADILVREGLVERHASAEDRRCVMVDLTEEGRRALLDKRRDVRATRRRLARLLDDDERAQATRLLLRLADAMEEL
jgi:MarR family transcriptional regulator, organic hydroperoxide resistance regulator